MDIIKKSLPIKKERYTFKANMMMDFTPILNQEKVEVPYTEERNYYPIILNLTNYLKLRQNMGAGMMDTIIEKDLEAISNIC